MSHLASIRVAKANTLTEIRMSKRVGRPIDDPSLVEVADVFLLSPVSGRSLEATMKSELEGARDHIDLAKGIGGMVCMATDGSGLTATIY